MPSIVIFTGPNGKDPLAHIRALGAAAEPTVGDALFAGQMQRTLILDRTSRGLDSEGIPFAPYAENHPYTLYPNRGGSPAARSKAAGRVARITGGKRTPFGVRYPSYGAAKRAFGRTTVDLLGLENHTHMLNTIVVKCGSEALGQNDTQPAAIANTSPAEELRIGFYGPEAARAQGNNEGVPSRKLPRRHFFDSSESERQMMLDAMGKRIQERVDAV